MIRTPQREGEFLYIDEFGVEWYMRPVLVDALDSERANDDDAKYQREIEKYEHDLKERIAQMDELITKYKNKLGIADGKQKHTVILEEGSTEGDSSLDK